MMSRNHLMLIAAVLLAPVAAAGQTDDALINEIQRKALDYFLELQHPQTGLILDRANNFTPTPAMDGPVSNGTGMSTVRPEWTYAPASTATVGFGLAAYVVGADRGWITREEAYERCLKALRFYRDRAEVHWGFYYHFVDARDGARMWNSEVSTIDTVLFLAGALTAAEYFKGTEVDTLARELYERVDWPALLSSGKRLISMGWNPERGLLASSWDSYAELLILYLMAIGSPTHPVPADLWDNWRRPVGEYDGHISIAIGPLFTHQYSHLWIDFRNKHDRYADYFENSRQATLANRAFCARKKKSYRTYDDDVWGLTACDGPDGYRAYGGPPAPPIHDGTVAPTAAGGSIVFAPDEAIRCLKTMKERHGGKLWGKYGFSDAFNVDRDWWDKDVIGIDQGAMLLMIENYRTGLIWELFMRQEWVKRAMDSVGFKPGTKRLTESDVTMARAKFKDREDRPRLEAAAVAAIPAADGDLRDWPVTKWVELRYPDDVETGRRTSAADLSARFSVCRTEEALALAVRVTDNDIQNPHPQTELYRGDLVEVYVDPQSNGLQWGDAQEFQIGVSPVNENGDSDWYAWFQNGRPAGISAGAAVDTDGYTAELVLNWPALGMTPAPRRIGFSVGVHDVDGDTTPDCKLQWFFLDPGILLGELILESWDSGVLADFNAASVQKRLGRDFGDWKSNPNDGAQGVKVDFAEGRDGACLRLRYDVESTKPAFNGFWMKLGRFDASSFNQFLFDIRGDETEGMPRRIKVELKTADRPASTYVEGISPEWRTVRLSKSDFPAIGDWSGLTVFVIVFEDKSAGKKTGAVYIDNIRFK